MKERYQQVVNKSPFINNLLISFFICLHERRLQGQKRKTRQSFLSRHESPADGLFFFACRYFRHTFRKK